MKKYNVYVRTPSKMIDYRGRVVRTPVELNGVTESELSLLKVKFNCDAITEYDISEIEQMSNEIFMSSPNPIGPEQKVIMDSIYDLEEKINTPKKTILNKILLEQE